MMRKFAFLMVTMTFAELLLDEVPVDEWLSLWRRAFRQSDRFTKSIIVSVKCVGAAGI
jgi:hypothetical protein